MDSCGCSGTLCTRSRKQTWRLGAELWRWRRFEWCPRILLLEYWRIAAASTVLVTSSIQTCLTDFADRRSQLFVDGFNYTSAASFRPSTREWFQVLPRSNLVVNVMSSFIVQFDLHHSGLSDVRVSVALRSAFLWPVNFSSSNYIFLLSSYYQISQ